MSQYSIRRQVTLLTMTPLLVMAVCLEVYFLHDRFEMMDENLLERGKLISRQLASSAEYGVFSNNRAFLQNLATDSLQQPDVKGVIVLNGSIGMLTEAGEFSGVPKKAMLDFGVESKVGEQSRLSQFKGIMEMVNLHQPTHLDVDSLRIFHPIVAAQVALGEQDTEAKAAQVGAVIVEMSLINTNRLKTQMLWVTVGATALFLIFPMCLIYLGSRSIVTPIRKLRDVVQALGDGDLTARAPTSHNVSELVTLAAGINEMAGKLQHESQALQQRVEAANRVAAIAFESHEGMLIADADINILRINNSLSEMIGYSQADLEGKKPHVLCADHHNDEFVKAVWDAVNSIGDWQGEIWTRRKDGKLFPAWVNITAVKNEDLTITNYIATYTDITKRKADEDEIKNMAFNDTLTQLPNRRVLIDRLKQAMAVSKRTKHYSALMFIDLDKFKPLNDKYGHEVGDLLLIEVANRLVSCIRKVDTVARFGGDEFIVMLSELNVKKEDSIRHAEIIAEKIRAILAEPYFLEIGGDGVVDATLEHFCTSSIGVRMFLGHQYNAEEVIKRADMAMYLAKSEGSNTVRFCELD
ncbi:MAG: diguanylate cyclase [Gallionella sp.]